MAKCNVTFTQTTFEVKDKTGAVIYEYVTNCVWADGIVCEAFNSLTHTETKRLANFLKELYPNTSPEDSFDIAEIVDCYAMEEYPEYFVTTEEEVYCKTDVDVWAIVSVEPCEDTDYVIAIFPTLAEAEKEFTNYNSEDTYLYPMTYGNGVDIHSYLDNFGYHPKFTEIS